MATINARTLSRSTGRVLDQVVGSGEPFIVSREGKPLAVLLKLDLNAIEGFAVLNTPGSREAIKEAEEALSRGETVDADELIGEDPGEEVDESDRVLERPIAVARERELLLPADEPDSVGESTAAQRSDRSVDLVAGAGAQVVRRYIGEMRALGRKIEKLLASEGETVREPAASRTMRSARDRAAAQAWTPDLVASLKKDFESPRVRRHLPRGHPERQLNISRTSHDELITLSMHTGAEKPLNFGHLTVLGREVIENVGSMAPTMGRSEWNTGGLKALAEDARLVTPKSSSEHVLA